MIPKVMPSQMLTQVRASKLPNDALEILFVTFRWWAWLVFKPGFPHRRPILRKEEGYCYGNCRCRCGSWCPCLTPAVVSHVFYIWPPGRFCASAASIMRPLSRGRPGDNSAVHGASEDVPGMTYDVPGVSYPIPWTSGDCPQGVRPADGPGTHSLASTGPFSQAAVHRASGLLRFSQSQRGRIMDRKWGCPQYVRNRKLMSRSCPGNATATLLAALTFFVKNKLILL